MRVSGVEAFEEALVCLNARLAARDALPLVKDLRPSKPGMFRGTRPTSRAAVLLDYYRMGGEHTVGAAKLCYGFACAQTSI